jgi:hypothetical protein
MSHTEGLNAIETALRYSPHFTRKSLPGVAALVRFGGRGKFTGGWTKGLLLVENSTTHEGVTLLQRLKTSSS